MEIGTNYSGFGLRSLWARQNGETAAATTPSQFGPPANVSINGNTVVGFTDYTSLGVNTWQFDLVGVLNPADGGLPTQLVSDAQAEQEQKDVEEAFKYIDAKDYAAARYLADGILEQNQTNAAAYHVLGYIEQEEGNYEKAEQLFLKAHALNPSVGYNNDVQNAQLLQRDDRAVYARARSLVNMPGQRGEGIRLLLALTERSPNHTQARMLLGNALLDEGDGANGLMQFSTAVRTALDGELDQVQVEVERLAADFPQSAFVRTLLGKIELRRGHYDVALQTLMQATQLADGGSAANLDLAAAYVGIGREKLDRGDISGAMSAFEQAREYDATGRATKEALAEGYIARAEQANRRRDYRGAAADLGLAADTLGKYGTKELRQRGASAAWLAGRALEKARIAAGAEIDSEVVAYQAAYDLYDDSDNYREKLAATRNAIGDQYLADNLYEEAAWAYKRAYVLDPRNETYRDNTINAFIAHGDDRLYNLNYTDAIEAYRAAFEIDTDNATSRAKLANGYTRRGLEYEGQEEWRKAMLDFKEALRLLPDNAEYQANYDRVKAWDY